MLFKGKLAQFVSFWATFELPRLVVFHFFDPIIERLYLLKIRKMVDVEISSGDQLTTSELEKFFSANSLFFQKSMMVINAHFLDKDAIELIERNSANLNKYLILFSCKDIRPLNPFTVAVEAPTFSERRYLWSFFVQEVGPKVDQDTFNYLLEAVNDDVRSIFDTLALIKTNFTEELITLDKVKALVGPQKQDLFNLSRQLGLKNFKQFFALLIEANSLETFSFLMNFLSKLASAPKKVANKYQREIVGYARNWKKGEIAAFSNILEELIILSKENPTLLGLKLLELESAYLGA
jgi:hypothetical protein